MKLHLPLMGRQLALFAGTLVLSVNLIGCAAVPTDPEARAIFDEINDPYEPFNRNMFEFNMAMDDAILEPVAKGYVEYIPDFVQARVSDLLNYLSLPIILTSHILQGDGEKASDTVGRLMINTLGLGFNDIASSAGIPLHRGDFGQTLGKWGVAEGPYVVLPFVGSYNARHGIGDIAEMFVNPVTDWEFDDGNEHWGYTHMVMYGIDWRAENIERIQQLEESSLDFYATARSAYRQSRRAMVEGDGSVEMTDPTDQTSMMNDSFDDFEDPDEDITQEAAVN